MKSSNDPSAFTWSKLDNKQRKKVIQRFEKDYGNFFAAEASYGNEFDKPPVKAGMKLSSKRKFEKYDIGSSCDNLLSWIFEVRTKRDFIIHAPLVVEETNKEDLTLYCTGIVVGKEEAIEQSFLDEESAKKAVEHFNDVMTPQALSIGIKKQVIKKTFKAGELKYWNLYVWNYESSEYELSKDYPLFTNKKLALGRAETDFRFMIALGIQWETWEDAGFKKDFKLDFTRENSFKIQKKNFLTFCKMLCEGHDVMETSYGSKVLDPKVDEEFIKWCEENL